MLYRQLLMALMNPAVTSHATWREAIRGAWIRYVFVSAGLALLLITVPFFVWPQLDDWVVERFLLSRYEERFGFHGGWIRPADSEYSVYGITHVVPDGRLARAGVKAGDLPVHGGMSLYHALQEANEGREGRFAVVSDPRDWFRDRESAREIRLAPK